MKKIMALLLVLAVVVGCTPTPTVAPQATATVAVAPTATTPPEVTVKFLSVQQETDGFTRIIGELSREYQAVHPNLTYEYENIAQDQLEQRVAQLAASDALPTLFNYQTGSMLGDLANTGKILDFEATFKDLGIYDKLAPGAVALLKRLAGLGDNAGLYALPLEMNLEGFWYNKAIFADNNLEVPTTWDELLQAATTLKAAGIQPFAVSGDQKWPITRLINAYAIRKYGYDVMDRVASGELKLTDAGFVEAAQTVRDMGLHGWFGAGVTTISYDAALDLFLQGKAAMFYMGSWALGQFNDPERDKIGADNIGLFNVPLVTGGVGTMDDWNINCGIGTSASKAAYNATVGDWMVFVFSNYGERALSELGQISGFKVATVPAGVPALTQLVSQKLGQVVNASLWWEAKMGPMATSVAHDNAQLLVTSASYSAEQYMTDLQAAIDQEAAQ